MKTHAALRFAVVCSCLFATRLLADLDPLLVNEVMAKNETTRLTADGAASDWFELYNTGTLDLDISGWLVCDDASKSWSKWQQFPAGATVPANGYLLVWADDYTGWTNGELHVNLGLSDSGESVVIADAASNLVAQLDFPMQIQDVSYGRGSGTDAGPYYFRTPTPGAANTTPGLDPITPAIVFSEPHGYKTAPFSLSLSCPDAPAADIYYTLDGSTPTTADGILYTAPITISSTTIIRAAIPNPNAFLQTDSAATYLFLDDILAQSSDTPAGFPADRAVNNQHMRYGMLPAVVNGADRDRLLAGFTNSICTLSVIAEPGNLFNATTGIYVNTSGEGREWERVIHIEQIDPVHGAANEFSVPAGMRLRGSSSRTPNYAKHSFRLFFRAEYGMDTLKFPLFGDEGAKKFSKVDLRTSQNHSWSNENSPKETFVHEVFSRDSQRDMGEPYTRSRFYNLFLNGVYWGLYQTQERGDHKFASTYLGGNDDNWDVIKTDSNRTLGANEGTMDAYNAVWRIAVGEGFAGSASTNYWRLLGLNPDGTRNPDYPIYLNPTNLAVYNLVSHFTCDGDAPTSAWGGFVNNIYALRDRVPGDADAAYQGFTWLHHDAEHSLGADPFGGYVGVNIDNTLYGTEAYNANYASQSQFNPAELHYKLMDSPDYRMLFADLVLKHCFGEGALTAAKARERFESRMAEIDDAVVCEAARWGQGRTRADWLSRCTTVLNDFIDARTPLLVGFYRARGWYPSIDAPVPAAYSGTLAVGESVRLTASTQFYYTTDGSDPRAADGSVSASAIAATAAPAAPQSARGVRALEDSASYQADAPASAGSGSLRILARSYDAETPEWSALLDVTFSVAQGVSAVGANIRVAEVMSSTADGNGDGSEYIVLTNLSAISSIDLSSVRITCAKPGKTASIDLTLPAGTSIAAGGTLTLDKATYWPDTKITNGQVDIALYDADTSLVQTLFVDASWWDAACDGTGASFLALDFSETVTTDTQWKPSFTATSLLRVREVLAVTADSNGDGAEYIVLTNLGDTASIDLSAVSISVAASGSAPAFTVTFPADTSLAPGATLTLDRATYWSASAIPNTALDIVLTDTNDSSVIQTVHLDPTWCHGAANGTGLSFVSLDFAETATAASQWGSSILFECGAYNTGSSFDPLTPNALLGILPSAQGGSIGHRPENNKPTGGTDLLTDGAVPDDVYSGICVVASGVVLTYQLANSADLYEMRFQARWGDNGRDRVHYDSIEVQDSAGVWSTLTSFCPNEHLGEWNDPGYNNSVSRPRVSIRRADGAPLATDVTAIRINFGHQENDYAGYTEIEARVSSGPILGAIQSDSDFYSATLGGTLLTTGISPGTADVYLSYGSDAEHLDTLMTVATGLTNNAPFSVSLGNLTPDTTYAYTFVATNSLGLVSQTVSGTFSTLSLAALGRQSTDGDYIYDGEQYIAHVFTQSGTFTTTNDIVAELLVVGGGGGGGWTISAGGGGGEVVITNGVLLQANTTYTVTIGAGGGPTTFQKHGSNGESSSFGNIVTALGGGGGAGWDDSTGCDGASGGGGANHGQYSSSSPWFGGQPLTPTSGHVGGDADGECPGGGGGAGGPGGPGVQSAARAGDGGLGIACDFSGTNCFYGAGGGGGAGLSCLTPGVGGSGVGGNGSARNSGLPGGDAVPNTGSGGGGGSYEPTTEGGHGSAGIVIVRYVNSVLAGNPVIQLDGSFAVTVTNASASVFLSYGGASATCDIYASVAPVGSVGTPELVLDDLATSGRGPIDFNDLLPGTDYAYTIVAEDTAGNRSEILSGTFRTVSESYPRAPGLTQVSIASPNEVVDTTTTSDDPAATDPHRTLGPVMAFTFADPANNATYVNEVDGETLAWANYLTFLYEGDIYLEQGITYGFAGNVDDTTYLKIDGTLLLNNSRNEFVAATYQPTYTGWHPIEIRLYNGIGGAGGNTEKGDFKLGVAYNTTGATAANSSDWIRLKDPGDASLLSTISEPNVLTLVTATRAGAVVNGSVHVSAPSPCEITAAYGATYGGAYTSDWEHATAVLGTTAAGGGTVPFSLNPGEGAVYVRFFATATDDIGSCWVSPTYRIEDFAPEGANPSLFVEPASATTSFSATFPVVVSSLGAGASSCDLTAAYGLSADSLSATNLAVSGMSVGATNVVLSGLLPDRLYYVLITGRNNLGLETVADILTVRTAVLDESDELVSLVSHPGLWQAGASGQQWAGDPATAAGHVIAPEGAIMACVGDTALAPYSSYTDPNGTVHAMVDNYTYAYSGYMWLEAGTTYTFGKCYDDGASVTIDGQTVINNNSWNASVYGSHTPATTGWHPIDIRLWNGSSSWGVNQETAFGLPYLGSGIAYSTNATTLTTDNWTSWHAPTNTADAILFRTAPFLCNPSVASYAADTDGVLSAELVIEPDGAPHPLLVAYGATYGGTDTNDWAHIAPVASLAADSTSATDSGTVTGIGTDVHFVRYFIDSGDLGIAWSETLVFGDASNPSLGVVTLSDVREGDGFTVNVPLASTGGDACNVRVEVSPNADLSDPFVWDAGTYTEPAAISVHIHTNDTSSAAYITPGGTYTYRVVATTTSGLDATAPGTITTPDAAVFGPVSASADIWTVTFTGSLADVGAGNAATVWLYTGANAGALAQTGDPQVLTSNDPFSFDVTYPTLEHTVHYAFLVSNACETAFWTAWSDTGSIGVSDNAVYYWKGDVPSGAWNDADNWENDHNDPLLAYPNGTNSVASFAHCDNGPVTVTLPGAYNVRTLDFGLAGCDVTFAAEDAATGSVTANSFAMAQNVHVTIDGARINNNSLWNVPSGFRGLVRNAGYLYVYHTGSEGIHFSSGDIRMEVRGDSTLESFGHISTDGPDVRLVIDDSLLQCGFYFVPARGGNATSNIVEFIGSHPKFTIAGACSPAWDNQNVKHGVTFLYHVPRDGYAEAPLQRSTSNQNGNDKVFAGENNHGAKVRFEIAPDSPAYMCGRHTMPIPLLSWPTYGIYSPLVDTENQPRSDYNSLYFKWGDALSGDGNPDALWANLTGLGFTVIVVQ